MGHNISDGLNEFKRSTDELKRSTNNERGMPSRTVQTNTNRLQTSTNGIQTSTHENTKTRRGTIFWTVLTISNGVPMGTKRIQADYKKPERVQTDYKRAQKE